MNSHMCSTEGAGRAGRRRHRSRGAKGYSAGQCTDKFDLLPPAGDYETHGEADAGTKSNGARGAV